MTDFLLDYLFEISILCVCFIIATWETVGEVRTERMKRRKHARKV